MTDTENRSRVRRQASAAEVPMTDTVNAAMRSTPIIGGEGADDEH